MTPDYWSEACDALSAADPVMSNLVAAYKGESLKARGDAFYTLARSIVGQQISVKAADSVWNKLENKLTNISYKSVINTDFHDIRACGLSQQKVLYLKEIAHFFHDRNGFPEWGADDKEIIRQLVSIKGVGVWTAEMFMIFHLLRPNILPLGDIGLLKAIYLYYNNGNKMELSAVKDLSLIWQPWATVATWHLWRALDPVPVAY